jgi:hypothetical protein
MSSSRGLRILGPMWALVSSSDSILVHYLCTSFVTKNSCNNSLFGPCMCVLCVNASMLAPRMDPG